MIVGIIGSKTYTDKRKVEDMILRLKKMYSKDLVIASGGTSNGAEYYVRKYCLEYNIKYREYNPAYTTYNSNSALAASYYGRQYHGSQILHRYFILTNSIDTLIIFVRNMDELKHPFKSILRRAKKNKKECGVVV